MNLGLGLVAGVQELQAVLTSDESHLYLDTICNLFCLLDFQTALDVNTGKQSAKHAATS